MRRILTIVFLFCATISFAQVTAPKLGIQEIYSNSLVLSWTKPSGVASFELQRATDRNFTSASTIYSGANQLYQESSLTQNTWYYYRVRSYDGVSTYSSWIVDSAKTFWTPTASSQGGNRIATSADLSIDPFINVGDYLIVGTDSYDDGNYPWSGSIGGVAGLQIPQLPHYYNKVCILGGRGYDFINLDMSLCTGTKDSLRVVTNIGGQVQATIGFGNLHFVKFTGKYDSVSKTGNKNYRGFDTNDWSKLEGSFGFFARGNYAHPELIITHVHGNTDSSIIEYVETGEGGYSGMTVKNDNGTVPMKNIVIRKCYTHDTGGESYYIGSTQPNPQMPVIGFEMYDNLIARPGLNAVQVGQMKGATYIHNNVFVNGGFKWNHSFQRDQDQAVQLQSRENGSVFRDNLVVGNAGQWVNWFMIDDPNYDSPQAWQNTIVSHNLFTDQKSYSGGYITARVGYRGTATLDSNYFGGVAKSHDAYRAIFLADTGFTYGRYILLENFDSSQTTWNSHKNTIDNSIRSNIPLALGGSNVTNNGNVNDIRLSTPLRRPHFNNYMDLDTSYDYSSMEAWIGAQNPEWNLYNRAGQVWDSIKGANLSTSATSITIPTTHPTTINATVGTGKRYPVGERLDFTNGSNTFRGTVTAYNSSTGAVTLTSVSNTGTGTFSSWNVALDIESINVYRIYKLGEIVRYNGRFYKSLENNNTNNQPTGATDSHWQLLIFSNGRLYPPDDVRLPSNDFYAAQGMGLTTNADTIVQSGGTSGNSNGNSTMAHYKRVSGPSIIHLKRKIQQEMKKLLYSLFGLSTIVGTNVYGQNISSLRALTNPNDTTLYYVTENGKFYKYDSSDHVSIDDIGSCIVSSNGKRFKPVTNSAFIFLEDFGAKGDGSTDDTQAWQNAINYASSSGKMIVPWKNYKVSTDTMKSNVTITGSGNSWMLAKTGTYTPIFYFPIKSPRVTPLQNVTISGLNFQGEASPAYDSIQCGIDFTVCKNIRIRNCRFYDFRSSAVHLGDATDVWVEDNIVKRGGKTGGRNALEVVGTWYISPSDSNSVQNIHMNRNRVDSFATAGLAVVCATDGEKAEAELGGNIVTYCPTWCGIAIEAGMGVYENVHDNQVYNCPIGIYSAQTGNKFSGRVLRMNNFSDNTIDSKSFPQAVGLSIEGSYLNVHGNNIHTTAECFKANKIGFMFADPYDTLKLLTNLNCTDNIFTAYGQDSVNLPMIVRIENAEAPLFANNHITAEGKFTSAGLYMANCYNINVNSGTIKNAGKHGIRLFNITRGTINGVAIIDPNANGTTGSGLNIDAGTTSQLRILNCTAEDTRAAHLMNNGFISQSTCTNCQIINATVNGYTVQSITTSNFPIVHSYTVNGTFTQ